MEIEVTLIVSKMSHMWYVVRIC